jgi:hypothetical protein
MGTLSNVSSSEKKTDAIHALAPTFSEVILFYFAACPLCVITHKMRQKFVIVKLNISTGDE